MDLVVVNLAERPDMAHHLWDPALDWPRFLQQDPVGDLFFPRAGTTFAAHTLLAFDADHLDRPVARSCSVPFAFGGDTGRDELPDDGWDGVIRWAWLDEVAGRRPTHVSALEVTIRPDLRGTGLASVLLEHKRANAAGLGYRDLVAPVRPSRKADEPHTPMTEYASRLRADGLPTDPWLRLHVRAGGTIRTVCPRAMTISGSLAEWRSWTGEPFDASGEVVVPFALNPVHVSLEHDHAVYVEPAVWVHHSL
ncbi:N-acetyltransferase [Phycicoccus jejuensis]|uniref:N-acetyltransferase n=1 Tax=Phycicoccus jejuensis TaxID=367299 RepID=UPI00384D24F7